MGDDTTEQPNAPEQLGSGRGSEEISSQGNAPAPVGRPHQPHSLSH